MGFPPDDRASLAATFAAPRPAWQASKRRSPSGTRTCARHRKARKRHSSANYGDASSSTRPLVSTANSAVMTAAIAATAANARKTLGRSGICAGREPRADHLSDHDRPDDGGEAQPGGGGADAERAHAGRIELGRVEIDADIDGADEEIGDRHARPAPAARRAPETSPAPPTRSPRPRTTPRTRVAVRHSRWSMRRSACRAGRPPA